MNIDWDNEYKLGYCVGRGGFSLPFGNERRIIRKLLLSTSFPSTMSWVGMSLVIVGLILHSYVTFMEKKEEKITV